jgi:adenylate cyclase
VSIAWTGSTERGNVILKKYLPRFILGALCVVLMLGHAGQVWRIPFVVALEAYFYDVRVRMTMPDTLDERVVIVDIDEKSLAEVGRWPWGRNVLAELVRRLTDEYEVAVVGFDVVLPSLISARGCRCLRRSVVSS